MEIAMKLEDSPVDENAVTMTQIQTQLENLKLQLQYIKKGKEHREEVWCNRCRTEGHTKDHCSYFLNYLLSSAPNPLSYGGIPWHRICQVYGHRHEDCGYMQKMVMKTMNLYCTFCQSIGHEDKDYHTYDLLHDRTIDMYYVNGEDH